MKGNHNDGKVDEDAFKAVINMSKIQNERKSQRTGENHTDFGGCN